MDFQSYWRAIRNRWGVVVGVTLVALAIATGLTALTAKTYQSSVSFFVSTSDTSDSNQLAQGGTFTQQRVKSYTQLVNSPAVLDPVAKNLNIKGGSDAINSMVSAKAATDTVIIDVAVTSTDAKQTAQIAQGIGQSFPAAVANLERVSAKKPSPVKVSLIKGAPDRGALVGPSWLTNLILAGFLGLMAGLALALLRERSDTTVRTREDMDRPLDGVTVLGTIPFDSDASSKPLILDSNAHTSRAEAFRSLRTNLRFIDAAHNPRAIVVTSAIAGEGKSSTTANLALALAQSNSSVCLIEGDLRRPRLLQYLGMEGSVGLTDVLIGQAESRDVAQRFGDLPLMVIGAGPTPPNPSELLGSEAMGRVLADLRERFDYIIIDAPPLLPVTDAAVLSTMTDGALLVSGAKIVRQTQVHEAVEHLRSVHAPILGAILNRARKEGRASYYDYSSATGEQEQTGRKLPFGRKAGR